MLELDWIYPQTRLRKWLYSGTKINVKEQQGILELHAKRSLTRKGDQKSGEVGMRSEQWQKPVLVGEIVASLHMHFESQENILRKVEIIDFSSDSKLELSINSLSSFIHLQRPCLHLPAWDLKSNLKILPNYMAYCSVKRECWLMHFPFDPWLCYIMESSRK